MPRNEGLQLSDEYLENALALDPKLSEAHTHATTRAGMFGDIESARASYEKAIEYGPSNAQAYLAFGIALRRARLFPEALEVLSKGFELDPYNPWPWMHFNLGDTNLHLGNYETGMQHFGKSYLANRGSRLAGQSLGWLALGAESAGQYDQAIAAYEIALRDGHETLRARALLARALLIVGDTTAASEELAQAEELKAQQRAANRGMSGAFWWVEDARLYFDLVTSDYQHQLLVAKHYTELANAGPVDGWDYHYEAAFLNTMLGRYEDAARTADQLIADGAMDAENYALAAFAHRQIGNEEAARQNLDAGRKFADEVMAIPHSTADDLILVALFRAADGQNDAAIDILQSIYRDQGYRNHLYISYMPLFDNLRTDPRYIELIRKMRMDTDQMRERVKVARQSGEWESILSQYLES